ncbi:HmuY family protein [Flavobacterium procerum]|uniref:HmuY family protein n=1 Tax=Flavobacterium procerum TaxID=1455569 RepID=A0ABV6BS08_9FLAO
MKRTIAMISLVMALLISCTKEEEKADLFDGKSTVIEDLPGDIGASMAEGVDGKEKRPFQDWYFNMRTKTQVKDTAAYAKTNTWDIGFTGIYNSMVVINSGTDPKSPGYGGPGKGLIVAIEKSYSEVTEAPSLQEMQTKNLSFVGWDGYPQAYNTGWYFYDLKTHISVPVKGRTFVLLTADGKFAKLEILNIYKGNPNTVTDLHWPAPYFTFRYYIQEDGSRNLNTN